MNMNETKIILTADDRTSAAFKSAQGSIASLKGAAAGLGVAFSASSFVDFIKSSVDAAITAEQASAKLDAVLKATGYSAGITRKELDGMADAMAKATQFDDESIRNASAELLKYGNIQGDVFREAIKLSADVAAFNGEDIAAAAQNVGKALLDVETASKLLKTAGVALSEQQKDQVKAFTESGQTAKAQQIVLDLLKKTYDGMAVSMNTGLKKSVNDVKKSWDELLESIGKTPAVQGGTTSFLDGVAKKLEDIKSVVENGDWIDKLSAVGKVALLSPWVQDFSIPDKSGRTSSGKIKTGASQEDLGAANQRLKEAEDAEYSRRKKLAEEAKKHVKEMVSLAEKQRKAMADSNQWAADSFTQQLDEANKAQAEWQKTVEETARGYVDMISPVDEVVRKMQTVEFLMETINKDTGQPFLSADQGQLALLNLNEQVDGLNNVKVATKEAADFGKEMGLTFSSAFEDSIVKGAEFGDMLKSLSSDIARIVVRKSITEPLGNSVKSYVTDSGMGDWLKNLFPKFDVGTNYVPRDMIAQVHKGEAIVPAKYNTGGGGATVVINQTNNIGSGVERGEFAKMLEANKRETVSMAVAAVADANRRGMRVY